MDWYFGLDALWRVVLSMLFVLAAALISRWQQADLERDLLVATLRSFLQLLLIGYALELVFRNDSPWWTLLVLSVMLATATNTIAARTTAVPNNRATALVSMVVGTALTIGTLLGLGVFRFTPVDIIPIGGMVIGNAMTTATLVMTRLDDDFNSQRGLIEARLALGATERQATLGEFQRALRSAMVPIIDTTKTVGLVKLPGAMTGMILAGASPLAAVQLQMIVMYMLVGASTFTGLTAAYLTVRACMARGWTSSPA